MVCQARPYFITLVVNLPFYCRTLTSITIATMMITTTITTIIKIWTENEDFPVWWSPKIDIVGKHVKSMHNGRKISKVKKVKMEYGVWMFLHTKIVITVSIIFVWYRISMAMPNYRIIHRHNLIMHWNIWHKIIF